MDAKNVKGKFKIIESFAIRTKKEFYLIGDLINGQIQKN